jgi:hypothetical protein
MLADLEHCRFIFYPTKVDTTGLVFYPDITSIASYFSGQHSLQDQLTFWSTTRRCQLFFWPTMPVIFLADDASYFSGRRHQLFFWSKHPTTPVIFLADDASYFSG